MSLKKLFILLAVALTVIAVAMAGWLFRSIAEKIVDDWGKRIVEVQVRYDAARLQKPLQREIALALQMADSNVLKRWAQNAHDPELTREALAEMESFRRNFRDHNFFVALRQSGAYYFNDRAQQYRGKELRYHLSPDKPDDAWFYLLIEARRPFHLNVNPDTELGITQLWIDALMFVDDEPVGMVGTGVELEGFLRDIVDTGQAGITTMFVDQTGAIQLYRDSSLIDYASIVKPEGQKNTIDLLLDTTQDYQLVSNMMKTLGASDSPEGTVLSEFVRSGGKRVLAGVAFLPEIGWYEISLIDLETFMPVSHFVPIALLFVVTLLLVVGLFFALLQGLILVPVSRLTLAIRKVRDGKVELGNLPRGNGEVGELISHFEHMAEQIREHTGELERKVAGRTEALEKQARTDALTGLSNRYGLQLAMKREHSRALRNKQPFGLIWLDIDLFKTINDTHGHAIGDEVLRGIAKVLIDEKRGHDVAARWGGDEFLMLVATDTAEALYATAERVRRRIEQDVRVQGNAVTVSLGAALSQPGEALDDLLKRVDDALYRAKAEGRNQAVLALPQASFNP